MDGMAYLSVCVCFCCCDLALHAVNHTAVPTKAWGLRQWSTSCKPANKAHSVQMQNALAVQHDAKSQKHIAGSLFRMTCASAART